MPDLNTIAIAGRIEVAVYVEGRGVGDWALLHAAGPLAEPYGVLGLTSVDLSGQRMTFILLDDGRLSSGPLTSIGVLAIAVEAISALPAAEMLGAASLEVSIRVPPPHRGF